VGGPPPGGLSALLRALPVSLRRPPADGGPDGWSASVSVTTDDLEPECEFPGLVQALFTPEVREATVANGLVGWRIEGRDLVFVAPERPTPSSPAEIVAVVERLVALARLFPAEAARLYGTPPVTDIPSLGTPRE
jgi:hypothetical protein